MTSPDFHADLVAAAFPDTGVYNLSVTCPTCKARPGTACEMKYRRHYPFHQTRQSQGAARYDRDVQRAPWMACRIPGRCYCSIIPTGHQVDAHKENSR